jgi:hypothetical protein
LIGILIGICMKKKKKKTRKNLCEK